MPEGIVVRDRPKPYEAWAYDPRTDRKVRKSFKTEREAKTWRNDTIRALRTGTLRAGPSPRLRDAAVDLVAGMRDGTIRARGGQPYRAGVATEYEQTLKRWVLPDLGPRRLSDITHPDLLDLADRLAARGLAPSSVRNAIDPLRVIYRRAVARGVVAVNPTTGLELPTGDRTPRDRVADPVEAAALIAALPKALDRALWATALYAGLRAGELVALRWADVDLAASRIRVTASIDRRGTTNPPKTRAGTRNVPIPPHLRRHLVEHRGDTLRQPDEYVFAAIPDQPAGRSCIYRRARKAWTAAKLESITLHEARHSCVSTWIAAGVNLKVASSMAGHASISITLDRYGHLLPGAEDEAMERLTAYVGASSGASPTLATRTTTDTSG